MSSSGFPWIGVWFLLLVCETFKRHVVRLDDSGFAYVNPSMVGLHMCALQWTGIPFQVSACLMLHATRLTCWPSTGQLVWKMDRRWTVGAYRRIALPDTAVPADTARRGRPGMAALSGVSVKMRRVLPVRHHGGFRCAWEMVSGASTASRTQPII